MDGRLAEPSPGLAITRVIKEREPLAMTSYEWRVSVRLESERGLGQCSGLGRPALGAQKQTPLACLRNVVQSTT